MKIILLGSSPAMMLQAIMLSQKYNDIEIHEGKKVIGGSWKTSNFFNIENIETGTHILAPWKNKLTYEKSLNILKKKLGLELYLLKPDPEKISNKNLKKNDLIKIKYFYIKGGTFKIIKNLKLLLKKKKIKILTNSKIKKIYFNEKRKLIYTNKKTFFADKIYLPYYCDFDRIFLKKNNLNLEKKNSIHLILEFQNQRKFKKKFSYIQHPTISNFIDRTCELSENILLKKKLLFCSRLSDIGKKKYKINPFKLAKLIAEDLFKYLNNENNKSKKLNFNYNYYEYETSYRNKENLKKLKKFVNKNNLNLVDTSQFMKYIGRNLKKLKKLENYEYKSR